MNTKKKTKEFKHFDDYRVSHHIGSELIEIEVLRARKTWYGLKKWEWNRIYFGHSTPMEWAVNFYQESKEEESGN
jgi:hypothetical protein